jgi:hypothetical protein
MLSPLAAGAQQAAKLPTIGFLGAASASAWSQWTAAFVQLAEKLSALRTETYFAERAARANIPKALDVLKRAGVGNAPMQGDKHIAERGAFGFRKHKRHHARKARASEA